MASRKRSSRANVHARRKIRTRGHVIADIAVNHVEGFVLRCGFSCEKVRHDYGIDLIVFTYDERGRVENGTILLQLKASDSPKYVQHGSHISVQISNRDVSYWAQEIPPVILVMYDAKTEKAYWEYIQRWSAGRPRSTKLAGQSTIRIPVSQRINRRSINKFARYRDERHNKLLEGLKDA